MGIKVYRVPDVDALVPEADMSAFRTNAMCLMFSRSFFVPDFVRRFFVSCVQIFEAYAVRTLMKFGRNWRKIGHKGRYMKDSEKTSYLRRKGT